MRQWGNVAALLCICGQREHIHLTNLLGPSLVQYECDTAIILNPAPRACFTIIGRKAILGRAVCIVMGKPL